MARARGAFIVMLAVMLPFIAPVPMACASGAAPVAGHTINADAGEKIPSMLLTMKDDGKTVEVGVSGILRVELEFPGATGYLWQPVGIDEGLLRPAGTSTEDVSGPGTTGGPVRGAWDFEALAPGETELVMKFYRPWEGPEKAVKRFSVRVIITGAR